MKMIIWEKASKDEIVCYCRNVTKQTIVRAIAAGADTVETVGQRTGAGTGKECETKHPEKHCCLPDVQALIDLYGPIFAKMRGGCG
jgi:NAD(P)H-nitrite reductase large subunit